MHHVAKGILIDISYIMATVDNACIYQGPQSIYRIMGKENAWQMEDQPIYNFSLRTMQC